MSNSAASKLIEYRVVTLCGRIISHSATDNQDLLDSFARVWGPKGLTFGESEPFAQWEAREIANDPYNNLEMHSDHTIKDVA